MDSINKYIHLFLNILRGSEIILACYFAGKYLSSLIHNFLSGSVIGMLLLFFVLCTGIVKKEHVQLVARFLLDNLILFFIPALVAVTLLDFNAIRPSVPDILLISVITTVIVMIVTGLYVQWRERSSKKPKRVQKPPKRGIKKVI